MLKIAVVMSTAFLASSTLIPVSSYSAAFPYREGAAASSKIKSQKKQDITGNAAKHFERQAIWPVYFYGCDDQPDCG